LGKGDKERLVPIGSAALKQINFYKNHAGAYTGAKGNEDILFLNKRGAKLSRVMIFYIIKEMAMKAGIKKPYRPTPSVIHLLLTW
jgi:integrase/recombinase XerD